MSLESALAFFTLIFLFGITPGPGVFALLARAMTSGARACWPLALGLALSDMVYLVLACYGLAALAEHWGGAFTVIRYAGAAYLCYLGWRLWTTPVDAEAALESPGRGRGLLSLGQGFLISASNPKVILFYIAFLPSFLDIGALSAADIVLASALTLAALMSGLMLIALGAAHARRYLRSARAVRGLNRTAGSLMVGAGAYLAARG